MARHPFPLTAVVDSRARVEEAEGAEGRRLLERHPEIARFAAALLRTDRSRAAFRWSDPSEVWWHVSLERSPRVDGGDVVTVSLHRSRLPHGLTGRELDVLTLVAGGLNNGEIATRLARRVRTVATHIEHLLLKLAQRTRAGAGAVAVDQGLLRLPIPGGPEGLEGLTLGLLARCADERIEAAPVAVTSPVRRPILLGSALALTGPAGADGIEMRNGATLAIREINARGGVGGRMVEHVVAPMDVFDRESVSAAFETLAAAEVEAVTSLYVFSEDAALEPATEYGAPFLHAMASQHMAEMTREDPVRHARVFQVCAPEILYGLGFVRFLQELEASRAWIPHRRSALFVETELESSQMATADTLEAAARAGWSVAGIHHVAARDADWSRVIDVIHRTDPGAVLVTDFLPSELAAFQRAFAAAPTSALVYCVYSPSVPEFLEQAGAAADGLVWSTVTGTYGDAVGLRFMHRYAQAFGTSAGRSHAGIAYDEVHLLAQAWASVESPRDFQAVAEHLRRRPFRGVNGSYFMDNESQSALAYPDMTRDPSLSQAHLVLQIQGGHHRVLSPAPYVEAAFEPPAWLGSVRASA